MDFTSLAAGYPTPFYAYDAALVRSRVADLVSAFKDQNVSLHYAVKANDNPEIIKMAVDGGIGACLVSAGEMKRAMAAGMKPENMLMNGVGKSDDDIRFALSNNIGQLNIESIPELSVIAAIARELGKQVKIGLRINPELEARTHHHITTARRTDKFGLLVEDLPVAKDIIAGHPELNWRGLSCHIGSQIHNIADLSRAYEAMVDLFNKERDARPELNFLDLGGGFGVSYTGDSYSTPADYAALVETLTRALQDSGVTIQMEPGRYIIAEAGSLVAKVLYVKHSGESVFVVVDGAMNDLIRPALYDAYHPISLVRKSSAHNMACTIVGPICESADLFGRDRMLPSDIARGDLLQIGFAGAYGHAMSSQYNARPLLAEILVDGDKHKLIRRAFSADEYDNLTLV